MFTLRQLEFAVAVAEEGSFTAAASRCHTVQSGLSHQIARLEEALGARLFERGPRRVRLTSAGEVFVRNARLTLQAAARLQAYLRDELEVEVGRLPAEMLVEFIGRDIGRLFYNRGLRDAETVVRQKVEDVADALYGLER